MSLGFTENDFIKSCKELESPQITDEWEFFTESHDVTIYRNFIEGSGLYQYKIYGFLNDVPPDMCAQVYMDLDYRKQWDSYVNELSEVEANQDQRVIYWQINFPWPLSNRDYVYSRELKEMDHAGNHIWCVLAKSVEVPQFPEKEGVVRVNGYQQSCCLMSDGKGGTKAFMHYYDNPGGNIPAWLINWGAKTGVPTFLTQMHSACRGYRDYLAGGAPATQ